MIKDRIHTRSCNKPFKILRVGALLFLIFILPLVACPLRGQVVQKKHLAPADYSLWGETRIDRVSSDEQWASYRVSYRNAIDSLFIHNISTSKTYNFPGGNSSIFTKDNHFICLTKKGINIQNLKTGQLETFDGVNKYSYCRSLDLVIIHKTSPEQGKELIIKTPFGKTIKKIAAVCHFSLSPDEQQLIYSTAADNHYNLCLLDLKNTENEHCIINDSTKELYDFAWQKEGKSVAFFSRTSKSSDASLYYYILQSRKLSHLDLALQPNFAANTQMVSMPLYRLLVSDDLQRIFFGYKIPEDSAIKEQNATVEIWNGNDKLIYSDNQKNGRFDKTIKIALWKPASNTVLHLSSESLPKIMLGGNMGYALLWNPKDYEPQLEMIGPSDYYLVNLETLEKKLFLKKHSDATNFIVPSPLGNYIAYSREGSWWIYDIKKDTHKNLTNTLGVDLLKRHIQLSPDAMCHSPGWSSGDREFLFYDRYDIWAVSPETGYLRRLTHGRESKIAFTIAPAPNKPAAISLYNGLVTNAFDFNQELYLKAEGSDGRTGFFKWDNKHYESEIVFDNSLIDQLYYGQTKKKFFYSKQRFDLSPQICFIEDKGREKKIFQSNPQQKNYYWGRSELIEYENSKKEKLKAVLIFPADYDPKKKYPMVVSIYELQSEELHFYLTPNHESGTGFNPAQYSINGFFVLLPDIVHENQYVGPSTADCTLSATNKIISLGLVDAGRIGLIGHSFGGYEAAYVITQTALFATAVAGGAITDLKSLYLGISQNSGRAEMWRFHIENWRMQKSPFEAPELYSRNSPLDHVGNVTTPLLLWSGKEDEQVDPHQSIEYYLALRRLGKKNAMLLYPRQGHNILNPLQHEDLTTRIQQWFDYYLKNKKSSKWVTAAVN